MTNYQRRSRTLCPQFNIQQIPITQPSNGKGVAHHQIERETLYFLYRENF